MNTAKITEKQQTVSGTIPEMNQVIIFLLILNLLNTRQVLQEKLMIFVLLKLVMMEKKVGKNEAEVIMRS